MLKSNKKRGYSLLMILILGFALIIGFSLITAEENESGNGNSGNENSECVFDSDCSEGAYCVEEECEFLDEGMLEDDELECVLDSDCNGNKTCIDGECDNIENEDSEEEMVELEIESEEELEINQNEIKYKYKYKEKNGEEVETEFEYKNNNRWEFRVGNYSASCSEECNFSVNSTQNSSEIKVKFSNGKYALIKIMPDTAAERAIERLSLKVCSTENNCTIELKDVGQDDFENETNASYEVHIKEKYKVLGIINSEAETQVIINAETGEVTDVERPWWSFLASKENN